MTYANGAGLDQIRSDKRLHCLPFLQVFAEVNEKKKKKKKNRQKKNSI